MDLQTQAEMIKNETRGSFNRRYPQYKIRQPAGRKKSLDKTAWIISLAAAAVLHAVVFFTLTFAVPEKSAESDLSIFKVVDIQVLMEQEELQEKEEKVADDNILETESRPDIAETITETEKKVVEVHTSSYSMEYLPQHKISVPPVIPSDIVKSRIEYPVLANLQKIEGVVFLELFIDSDGIIRKIEILKDPGYGLAAAAVKALEGVSCTPALANGKAVAVRYRYPVRFMLK